MFKRVLMQKPEPLLIVVPIILFLLYKLFVGSSALNASQEITFMQMNLSLTFWFVFAFFIAPGFMHYLLRLSRRWNPEVCRMQVFITIGLGVLFFVSYVTNSLSAHSVIQIDNSSTAFGKLWNANTLNAFILLLGWLVQVLFTGYFLVTIFRKAESNYKK